MVANIVTKMDSTNRSGKRRQVSKEECLLDLKKDLPKVFKAFNRGVKKFNKVSAMFRHE